MSAFWTITGTTTASLTAPTGSTGEYRIRAISGSCSAAGNLVASDSVLGTLWQLNFAAAGQVSVPGLDLRGSPGGTLTVSWSAGGATISVQGDYILPGYPWGLT